MKFKPLNKDENILQLARYNKNIDKKHASISHGFGSQEKRHYAALSMLGIMSYTKYYDDILKNEDNLRLLDVVNRLVNSASLVVDKTFLKDDGKKVL